MDNIDKVKKAIASEQKSDSKIFHFADRVVAAVKEKGTPICVGIDPVLAQIPQYIKDEALEAFDNKFVAAAKSLEVFSKGIIDAVYDLVPVVKPQIAYFEQLGPLGLGVYQEVIKYAKSKGLLVIADVKRADIGSTSEAYSNAFLGQVDLFGEKLPVFDADAVTVNPYLGLDGIKPFLKDAIKFGKGIFMLVKTSNASSADVQDLEMADKNAVYEIMGAYTDSWGSDDLGSSGYSLLGAVVGATFPEQAKKLRVLMPQTIFLVPGYGAQGGSAADVKPCFNEDGMGALINSSRAINFAYLNHPHFGEREFGDAAREAVLKMKAELDLLWA